MRRPCHFSALQPLLSTSYSPRQVKSLLVLTLLFWQRPTFTDTQIGDSPLLFREFIHPANESLGPLIRECFGAGEARLLVRNAFYRSPGDKLQDCNDLFDVYRGWQKQNMPEAWVVPPDVPNRERYVEQWSDAISKRAILTYDYLAVKQRFQKRARESIDRGRLKQDVDSGLYKDITKLMNSNWFSHSGIFALFKKKGLERSEWAQSFGLIDEAAYAESFEAGLAAINIPSGRSGAMDDEEHGAIRYVNEIMSRAFERVDGSDLFLLHLLNFDEIMRIRTRGAFLLDIFSTMEARLELSNRDLAELSSALASYWRISCEEMSQLHPGATKGKTRLGLLVARQSIVPVEELVDGLAVVLSGIAGYFTGGIEGQKGVSRKAIELASFRFLLESDRQELRKMRGVLSRNAVLRAQNIMRTEASDGMSKRSPRTLAKKERTRGKEECAEANLVPQVA